MQLQLGERVGRPVAGAVFETLRRHFLSFVVTRM
jgi:hypothetical protein